MLEKAGKIQRKPERLSNGEENYTWLDESRAINKKNWSISAKEMQISKIKFTDTIFSKHNVRKQPNINRVSLASAIRNRIKNKKIIKLSGVTLILLFCLIKYYFAVKINHFLFILCKLWSLRSLLSFVIIFILFMIESILRIWFLVSKLSILRFLKILKSHVCRILCSYLCLYKSQMLYSHDFG